MSLFGREAKFDCCPRNRDTTHSFAQNNIRGPSWTSFIHTEDITTSIVMFFFRRIPVCRQCTNEAIFFFILGLAMLLEFFAYSYIIKYEIDMVPGPLLLLLRAISKSAPLISPTLVLSIIFIPLSHYGFAWAIDCLLQPYYFRASGSEHGHLIDMLPYEVAQ